MHGILGGIRTLRWSMLDILQPLCARHSLSVTVDSHLDGTLESAHDAPISKTQATPASDPIHGLLIIESFAMLCYAMLC